MGIQFHEFSFKELLKIIDKWRWQEIKYGYDKKFLSREDIIYYAVLILDLSIEKFEIVLELSIASPEDDIDSLLSKLVNSDKSEDMDYIRKKWLFVIMCYLYYNKEKIKNIYETIEDIYSDFDYPEEIKGLIRYMPCDDYSNMSFNERWVNYIKTQEKIYK